MKGIEGLAYDKVKFLRRLARDILVLGGGKIQAIKEIRTQLGNWNLREDVNSLKVGKEIVDILYDDLEYDNRVIRMLQGVRDKLEAIGEVPYKKLKNGLGDSGFKTFSEAYEKMEAALSGLRELYPLQRIGRSEFDG